MKILIAPDKFKDALSAAEAAAALAAGARDARPDVQIAFCPLADGGEGTGRLLAAAAPAEERTATVLDPLGRWRAARWWLDASRSTAIIEMAEASGLILLKPAERDATRTSSFGTGQLIAAALAAGCQKITLCVGGSATVDGGAGCLQALGWRFYDAAEQQINEPLTGGQLTKIAHLKSPATAPPISAGLSLPVSTPPSFTAATNPVEILCDVDHPLLGPRGAAPVFAPQKGATPAQVRQLEQALEHWAAILERDAGHDVRSLPSGGAAGGLPAGLLAALHAQVVSGFAEVARRVDLHEKMAGCDWCFTGEGRIDEQTAGGKVVAGVARQGQALNVPVIGFVGAAQPGSEQTLADLAKAAGLRDIQVITPPGTPLPAALAATAVNLRAAAARFLSGGA